MAQRPNFQSATTKALRQFLCRARPQRSNESGESLISLLAAITIGLLLMAAAISLLTFVNGLRSTSAEQMMLSKKGLEALVILGSGVERAGLLSCSRLHYSGLDSAMGESVSILNSDDPIIQAFGLDQKNAEGSGTIIPGSQALLVRTAESPQALAASIIPAHTINIDLPNAAFMQNDMVIFDDCQQAAISQVSQNNSGRITLSAGLPNVFPVNTLVSVVTMRVYYLGNNKDNQTAALYQYTVKDKRELLVDDISRLNFNAVDDHHLQMTLTTEANHQSKNLSAIFYHAD